MATCPVCDGEGSIVVHSDSDGVDYQDECVHCSGLGTVDPGEDDGWADDVNRGIEAHRERMLD